MIDGDKLRDVVGTNIEKLCGHFFPGGKKENGEWKLGDVSGAKGNSLGICLSAEKAGMWVDRASADKGNFTQLLMRSRNLTFPGAADEIGRFLGVDLSTHTHYQPNAINWDRCARLAGEHVNRMAIWRGLSERFVNWLSEHDLLRVYGNNGSERWVLPVHMNGKVSGSHSRPIEWAGPDRCPWLIWPEKKKGGPGVQPLMIGDLANARSVHVFESQWDMFAVCDRLNLHETDGAAAFCTRGSANGGLVSTIPDTVSEVFLWQQNDDAGTNWTDAIIRKLPITATARLVKTPSEFEDPNAWTLKGKATSDGLLTAISAAVISAPAPVEGSAQDGSKDTPNPWCEALSASMCSSTQLQRLEVTPRSPILGDWFKEGDLGFIFAPRGVGKTWLAIDLAHGIAEGRDVGPWKHQEAKPVLYLDGEMPPDAVKSRDRGLGNETENLVYINHEVLFQRTGRVFNLGDAKLQQAIIETCLDNGIKVLFLDNLSTLVSGADENKGLDWEVLQPWLLQLRRCKISVVWIHHSGRNPKEMRGHSKREDSAFWVIRLERFEDGDPHIGAKFIARFTKCRNTAEEPLAHEWCYTPEGDKTQVTYRAMSPLDVLRQCVRDGLNRATDIAAEMGISKGYASKLAKKAEQSGWLKIENGAYKMSQSCPED
jgi:putative DNA primase/helicase